MCTTSGTKTFKATLTSWTNASDYAEVQLFKQITLWPDAEVDYLDYVFDPSGQSKTENNLPSASYYFLAGPQSGNTMGGTTYLT